MNSRRGQAPGLFNGKAGGSRLRPPPMLGPELSHPGVPGSPGCRDIGRFVFEITDFRAQVNRNDSTPGNPTNRLDSYRLKLGGKRVAWTFLQRGASTFGFPSK